MLGVGIDEGGADFAEAGAAERAVRHRHGDLVHLAEQAHFGEAADFDFVGRHARFDKAPARFGFEFAEDAVDRAVVRLGVEHRRRRARQLDAERRREKAERGRGTRGRRHDDFADAEIARHGRGMGRPGAAEADQRIAPRIAAFLDQVNARRARHAFGHDLEDAGRRRDRRQAERFRDLEHRALGRGAVELHASAKEEIRVEIAEHEIGVGHCWQSAALAVAGRAGIGPGAVRADLEQADLVDAGDRAAAGADFDHVDDRRLDRQAAALLEAMDAGRFHARGNVDRAVLHQAGLGRGAAHVEGDDVALAGALAEQDRRQAAAGRAGLQQPDREAPRQIRRRKAARGLHKIERARESPAVQFAFEPADIGVEQRLDIGVRRRRRRALVFAHLGNDLRRERDSELGEFRAQQLARRLFVGRVGIAMQEANGDRLDAVGNQRLGGAADFGGIERLDHPPVIGDALADLDDVAPVGQRGREAEEEVVNVVALFDAHFEDVAEARGREQADLGAPAFDDGVGDQRGAVQKFSDIGELDAFGGDQFVETLERAHRGIGRRRQALVQPELAAFRIEQDEIGEGAADIEADPIAGGKPIQGLGHRGRRHGVSV